MNILSISPSAEDQESLHRIVDGFVGSMAEVANCREAFDRLCGHPVSVVLCESVLEDGTWKDILSHLQSGRSEPFLIVTSRLADERLWAEVLNMGGYDVLAKPFHEREVAHVLTSASLSVARARIAGAD